MAKWPLSFCAAGGLLMIQPTTAGSVSIDFDVDAAGNPIDAPSSFDAASPLGNSFAGLGVQFAGPALDAGGAILNDSTFTTHALSGRNFLAFSAVEATSAGPETITFGSPMSTVSLSASSFSHPMAFSLQAFDGKGVAVASALVPAAGAGWNRLTVTASNAIHSVVFSAPGAGLNTYAIDDLVASPSTVPEPVPGLMFGLGIAALAAQQNGRWLLAICIRRAS